MKWLVRAKSVCPKVCNCIEFWLTDGNAELTDPNDMKLVLAEPVDVGPNAALLPKDGKFTLTLCISTALLKSVLKALVDAFWNRTGNPNAVGTRLAVAVKVKIISDIVPIAIKA